MTTSRDAQAAPRTDSTAPVIDADDPLAEFKRALGASSVVRVGRPGPLSITELLATRSWFDQRQRALRQAALESRATATSTTPADETVSTTDAHL